MKPQPANLNFDPRQAIGCREVAALLGISERTLRAGGEYRPLLARSFWLGGLRKWQAGFVFEWIASQQRRAIEDAEAAEQRAQQLSNVVSLQRPRKRDSKEVAFWQHVREENAARDERFARRKVRNEQT